MAAIETITYNLRAGEDTSDAYYQDVAAVADALLIEVQRNHRQRLERFATWVGEGDREPSRTPPEYAFDFLTLGVLWRTYQYRASGLPRAPRCLLVALVRLRQSGGALEGCADMGRGWLSGLSPRNPPPVELERGLHSLRRLQAWLQASGSFEQEVIRLGLWADFLADLPQEERKAYLEDALRLAAAFGMLAESALGRYTPKVADFLRDRHPGYRWRADSIFCGRGPLEYHLNMVGSEILNRAHRRAFQTTRRRLVLVPPCMRLQPDASCQAEPTSLGSVCAGCQPSCRVHHVTKLGEKRGFEVRILPDDLRVFAGPEAQRAATPEVGIVGVSCALTNASGGLETRALGVPAQGILLDYCGCRYHWHPDGFATDLNIGQLLRVLDLDEELAGVGEEEAGPG